MDSPANLSVYTSLQENAQYQAGIGDFASSMEYIRQSHSLVASDPLLKRYLDYIADVRQEIAAESSDCNCVVPKNLSLRDLDRYISFKASLQDMSDASHKVLDSKELRLFSSSVFNKRAYPSSADEVASYDRIARSSSQVARSSYEVYKKSSNCDKMEAYKAVLLAYRNISIAAINVTDALILESPLISDAQVKYLTLPLKEQEKEIMPLDTAIEAFTCGVDVGDRSFQVTDKIRAAADASVFASLFLDVRNKGSLLKSLAGQVGAAAKDSRVKLAVLIDPFQDEQVGELSRQMVYSLDVYSRCEDSMEHNDLASLRINHAQLVAMISNLESLLGEVKR